MQRDMQSRADKYKRSEASTIDGLWQVYVSSVGSDQAGRKGGRLHTSGGREGERERRQGECLLLTHACLLFTHAKLLLLTSTQPDPRRRHLHCAIICRKGLRRRSNESAVSLIIRTSGGRRVRAGWRAGSEGARERGSEFTCVQGYLCNQWHAGLRGLKMY